MFANYYYHRRVYSAVELPRQQLTVSPLFIRRAYSSRRQILIFSAKHTPRFATRVGTRFVAEETTELARVAFTRYVHKVRTRRTSFEISSTDRHEARRRNECKISVSFFRTICRLRSGIVSSQTAFCRFEATCNRSLRN